MSDAGQKIIDGLREAAAGDFAAVTIDGVRWTRAKEWWRPIETAPHNERIIVCQSHLAPNDEIAIAWRDRADHEFYYAPQGGILSWIPTHWRPVPPPPVQS